MGVQEGSVSMSIHNIGERYQAHDAVACPSPCQGAGLSPNQRHSGGAQPNVSGWGRTYIEPESHLGEKRHFTENPAIRNDAVVSCHVGSDTHASSNGNLHTGGRQESVSGWSRRHIPHGDAVPVEARPTRRVFPATDAGDISTGIIPLGHEISMAANNESQQLDWTANKRHYHEQGSAESTVHWPQRRHVTEPAPAGYVVPGQDSPQSEQRPPAEPIIGTTHECPSSPHADFGQTEKCLGVMPEGGFPSSHADLAALGRGEVFNYQLPGSPG